MAQESRYVEAMFHDFILFLIHLAIPWPCSCTDCIIHTYRFYEERFPEVDDVVMVQVRSIAEMGAYVSLLEYGNIEGMILFSELSRRRIRSVQKLIKVGRQEPVMVLRVDKEKGYIDLSKRRVSPEDVAVRHSSTTMNDDDACVSIP